MIPAILLMLCPGDVVYTNLQTNTSATSKTFIAGQTDWAQKITISSAFTGIKTAKLNLHLGGVYSGASYFDVFLTRDNAGKPGNVIAVLGGDDWQNLGTAANSTWDMAGTVSFSQKAAGDYWLMVQSTGASSLYQWSYGANTSAGQTAYYNGSAWTLPNNNNSLGAYVETVAVPEPGNFVMGVIAAVAGCLFWFFRLS